MTVSDPSIVAGIDIGGTYARVAILSAASGSILAMRNSPLEPARGSAYGIGLIAGIIRDLQREAGTPRLLAIGIGATGPVDPLRGLIQNPYTLPTWDHVPIVAELESLFHIPVVLENDADSAVLGEYWQGAGQGVERLYAVTVGTGIGTAFLQRGNVYRGLDGAHPEAGHHLVDPSGPLCYCGVRGCWESLASGTAIAQFAREAAAGTNSLLLNMADGNPEAITARMVADAARQKDPVAHLVLDAAIQHFIRGLLNIIAFYVPEMIVLSGGVMRSLDLFMPAIQKAVDEYSVMSPANQVKILPAKLGYEAGVVGAAFAAVHHLGLED